MSECARLDPGKMANYAHQAWHLYRPESAELSRRWRNDERETIFSFLIGCAFADYIKDNSEWLLELEFAEDEVPLGVILRSKWHKEIYFRVEVTHQTMALISDDRTSIERFSLRQHGQIIVRSLSKMIIEAINKASEEYEADLELYYD